MKEFSSYMVIMFMIIFWILRIVACIANTMYMEFPIIPTDQTLEVALLFVTLVCIVLVAKRQMVGAALYLIIYGVYFGNDITGYISKINDGMTLTLNEYTTLFVSAIGVVLPIITIVELMISNHKTKNYKDNKTDWFYKNKQFDREKDERADKNNYRTL